MKSRSTGAGETFSSMGTDFCWFALQTTDPSTVFLDIFVEALGTGRAPQNMTAVKSEVTAGPRFPFFSPHHQILPYKKFCLYLEGVQFADAEYAPQEQGGGWALAASRVGNALWRLDCGL